MLWIVNSALLAHMYNISNTNMGSHIPDYNHEFIEKNYVEGRRGGGGYMYIQSSLLQGHVYSCDRHVYKNIQQYFFFF